MAAKAPAFEACGVRIEEDPVKGKVVFAERAFAAGEVIFSEQAFVYATWSTAICDGCEEEKNQEDDEDAEPAECHCTRTGAPKEMYSKALTADPTLRNETVEALSEMEGIAEVDRARCILKCLGMFERDPASLQPVLDLTCANMERCLEEAKQIREELPAIIPEGFTDEQLAKLIGALNTNSHELENLGGSGLFLSACRMEHNCKPNCSFTTYDSELWMTAIRPIAAGEALSIDYGNFFYRPTEERMSTLQESYGFICSCDGCVVEPDECRAFKCKGCTDGVVLPFPVKPAEPLTDPEQLKVEWKCKACGHKPSENECTEFEEVEAALLENGMPETLEEMDEFLQTSPMHERHYLPFWALDAIGCEAAALNAYVDDEDHRDELAKVWQRLIKFMNVTVPYPHHEKTIYYDNLAQVEVILGNRNAAMEAYEKAYEVACIVSGTDCTPTKKLKELAENPPADAEELRKVYGESKRPELAFHLEEGEWEDEEEIEEEEAEEEA
ncbi:hypothetical protein ATCC90586_001419 [Pythium insidiosum]|nr:hypothetical protein ATCC90586_001419 [Pythium insidiosum]